VQTLERSMSATLAPSAAPAARATAGRPAPDSIASDRASMALGPESWAVRPGVLDFEGTPEF